MSLRSAKRKLAAGDLSGARTTLSALLSERGYPNSLKEEASLVLEEIMQSFLRRDQRLADERGDERFLAGTKLQSTRAPYRCTVIAWDVNHNCLGRAYLIKELASRVFEYVHLVGFSFTHADQEVWRPLRDKSLEITRLPEPDTAEDMNAMAQEIAATIDTDLIIACKPRLPTMLIALHAKRLQGIPFLVDIDDYERGFFKSEIRAPIDSIAPADLFFMGATRGNEKPYSYFWTRIAEELVSLADWVITSNTSLQKIYGGSVIPHVRDAEKFTIALRHEPPSAYSDIIGSGTKLVVFLGTPRRHKGIAQLASACADSKTEGLKLVIIGRFDSPALRSEVLSLGGSCVHLLDDIPLSDVVLFLAPARLVVLLQDQTNEASRYQLPAKAIDAIGLGVPILATETEPMRMLHDMGCQNIVFVDHLKPLSDQIDTVIARYESSDDFLAPTRQAFLNHLSFEAGSSTLASIIPNIAPSSSLQSSTGQQRALLLHVPDRLFRPEQSYLLPPTSVHQPASNGAIHVILWKQNDFGIYGRRVDMIAAYLASRDDVSKVLVFETPQSTLDIEKRYSSNSSHYKMIFAETQAKNVGARSFGKVKVASPVLPKGMSREEALRCQLAYVSGKVKSSMLSSPAANRPRIVMWLYPYYANTPILHAELCPDFTVCDVVDDHRSWSGMTHERLRKYEHNYQECFNLSDLVIFNNRHNAEVFAADFRMDDHLIIENGVDLSLLDAKSQRSIMLKQRLLSRYASRHIIGYCGNLEEKIDWELITKIAKSNPRSIVLLVGSRHMSAGNSVEPNVIHVDSVSYHELRDYLGAFDVAIIPHLATPQTKSMNPLKAYVYLTQKIPVITTDVPNLPAGVGRFPHIRVCKDHAEFLQQLEGVLGGGFGTGAAISDLDSELNRYLHEASWENRFRDLIDSIHGRIFH